MLIDQTFLRVHPRTQEWWAERSTCERCKHMRTRERKYAKTGPGSGGGAYCTSPGVSVRFFKQSPPCIDVRERECGPKAKLFEEK